MLQRVCIVGLLTAAYLASGCCVNRTHCGGGMCETRGPTPFGVGACGDCGGVCNGTLTGMIGHTLTCGSGCGEVYYDEWISDPPDCCDPCDDCGNWVGTQSCCRPLSMLRPCNLFGVRYHDDPCAGGASCNVCQSCGGAGCDSCSHGGEVMETIDRPMPPQPPMPTPAAPKMSRARRSQPRPYYTPRTASRSVVR